MDFSFEICLICWRLFVLFYGRYLRDLGCYLFIISVWFSVWFEVLLLECTFCGM